MSRPLHTNCAVRALRRFAVLTKRTILRCAIAVRTLRATTPFSITDGDGNVYNLAHSSTDAQQAIARLNCLLRTTRSAVNFNTRFITGSDRAQLDGWYYLTFEPPLASVTHDGCKERLDTEAERREVFQGVHSHLPPQQLFVVLNTDVTDASDGVHVRCIVAQTRIYRRVFFTASKTIPFTLERSTIEHFKRVLQVRVAYPPSYDKLF
ncbi:hypothetical protein CYMTET_38377 [Cymbomonas tetramitiformis]|uniref:Uncharacterized protein n=1 Tax=Cymbomonas tetramitiformis TaxID=36881 RepID=A0AAE0CC62_9CHLO|nr:hypothetical protein CYMTET_38377 [Cymbomonas tetramitiformis]